VLQPHLLALRDHGGGAASRADNIYASRRPPPRRRRRRRRAAAAAAAAAPPPPRRAQLLLRIAAYACSAIVAIVITRHPQQLREAAAAIMASDNDAPNILCWAGIAGASGVSVGAFGAHALKKLLESRGSTSTFQTGVQYHLIHAVALLGLAALPGGHGKLTVATTTAKCWLGGIALFSGSLYGLAGAESACLRDFTQLLFHQTFTVSFTAS
jgi:uncharacterized membrane protein YgdD (TMEM256/DUF423 family)